MNLWHLLFLIFFFVFVIKSGKIRPSFEEIFGDGWDKKEREEILVKIEQNECNENSQSAAIDQMGEEMENDPNDQQKTEIIQKFDAIKEKLREKGKFEWKNQSKIERKIAKLLGTNRQLIHKWKNELNLNKNKIKKNFYDEKKRKFIERFDEFKDLYGQGKQKEFAKELGISERTLIKWKKELAPKYHKSQKHHTNEDKLMKMKHYLQIKEANPKMSDELIANKLGIGSATLKKWKKRMLSSI